MTTIDTAPRGIMDKVNVEQQKQSQLVKDMQGLAKVQPKPKAEPVEAKKSGDSVEISDQARQASAERYAAKTPAKSQSQTSTQFNTQPKAEKSDGE